MSFSTSNPKTAGRRRPDRLSTVTAVAVVLALAAWATATYAVDVAARSGRSSAPAQAPALRRLTPAAREYVLAIASMTPAQVHAGFATSPTSHPARDSGANTARSTPPTLVPALRSLTPRERRYVLGIASLTPLQLWAAFGTTPTPPMARGEARSKISSTATTPQSVPLPPILPACGPRACWQAATTTGHAARR